MSVAETERKISEIKNMLNGMGYGSKLTSKLSDKTSWNSSGPDYAHPGFRFDLNPTADETPISATALYAVLYQLENVELPKEQAIEASAAYTPPPAPSSIHDEVSLLELTVTAAVDAHTAVFGEHLKKSQKRLGMSDEEVTHCQKKYKEVNTKAVTSSDIIVCEKSPENLFQNLCMVNEHTITIDKADLENKQRALEENIAFFMKYATPEQREQCKKLALSNTSAYSDVVLSQLDKNLDNGTIKTKQQLDKEIDYTAFGTTLVSNNSLAKQIETFRLEHDPKYAAEMKAKQILSLEGEIVKTQKEVSFSPKEKQETVDGFNRMITAIKEEPGVLEAYNELKKKQYTEILNQKNNVNVSNTWAMADNHTKKDPHSKAPAHH